MGSVPQNSMLLHRRRRAGRAGCVQPENCACNIPERSTISSIAGTAANPSSAMSPTANDSSKPSGKPVFSGHVERVLTKLDSVHQKCALVTDPFTTSILSFFNLGRHPVLWRGSQQDNPTVGEDGLEKDLARIVDRDPAGRILEGVCRV